MLRVRNLLLLLVSCFLSSAYLTAKTIKESPIRGEVSAKDIYQLFLKNKVTTIEAALQKLPSSLKKHFVLQYDSDSLQGSSYENPRAINSNEEGTLYLSFNGHSKQDGFFDMEFLEYVRGKVELYSIHFDHSGKDLPKLLTPKELLCKNCDCIGCHGLDPNNQAPIWSPHVRDRGDEQDYNGSYRGYAADVLAPSSSYAQKIETHFQNFLNLASGHDRYRELLNLKEGFVPDAKGYSKARHNLSYNYRIQRINADRVARVLFERGDFDSIKFDLMKASLGCPNSKTFIDFASLPSPIDIFNLSTEGITLSHETQKAVKLNPFGAQLFNSEILAAFLVYYDPELAKSFSIAWMSPQNSPQFFESKAGLGSIDPAVLASLPPIPVLQGTSQSVLCGKVSELSRF